MKLCYNICMHNSFESNNFDPAEAPGADSSAESNESQENQESSLPKASPEEQARLESMVKQFQAERDRKDEEQREQDQKEIAELRAKLGLQEPGQNNEAIQSNLKDLGISDYIKGLDEKENQQGQ